jgi:hypothetical protein
MLHDGCHLILEPQAWDSYARSKCMAEVHCLNSSGLDFIELSESGEGRMLLL